LKTDIPALSVEAISEEEVAVRDAMLDAIGTRIGTLVRRGRLEAAGNLSRWRRSEVRLPANAE
jgi:hypothetical protein